MSEPDATLFVFDGLNPDDRKNATTNYHYAQESKAQRQVSNGITFMTISGVVWLALSNGGLIFTASQLAQFESPSLAVTDARGVSISDSPKVELPGPWTLWFVGTLSQLSIAGVVVGMAMVILGYAKLFLAKQAVFEQRIEDQMNIRTSGDVIANIVKGVSNRMGDQTNARDIIGGAVGSGAQLSAHDITTVKNDIDNSTKFDNDLAQKLKAAREAIEALNGSDVQKKDIADDLGKIEEELEKPIREPGRIERLFNRIQEVAPDVASILSSTVQIGKMC